MAREWGIGREAQDELAVRSHHNLAAAYDTGWLDDLVVPFLGLERDQNLRPDSSVEKLAKLKPVFGGPEGTMTAGNSTPLSDGASTVLLASEEWAAAHGMPVQAYFSDAQTAAVDYVHKREGLLMAPAYAVPKMLARNGLTLQDFDFYEIHEAFAAQVLCTLKAWEDPVFCSERLGLDAPLGLDRPRPAERARRLARGRAPVRRHRRADRRRSGQGAVRARIRPRPDLDLRRRRTWSHRDHGGSRLMADRYQQLVNTPIGRIVAKQVGLPNPPRLERYEPGQPVIDGPVLLGAATGSRLAGRSPASWRSIGAEVLDADGRRLAKRGRGSRARRRDLQSRGRAGRRALQGAGAGRDRDRLQRRSCVEAWAFLHPTIRRVQPSRARDRARHPARGLRRRRREEIAQRALEGLVRAIGKEVGKGATSQLVYVRPGPRTSSSRRCASSSRPSRRSSRARWCASAPAAAAPGGVDWERPLAGKVALVTGAARGIGAAIAEVLARDGAHVVGLDVPAMADELAAVDGRLGRLVADRRHHRRRRPGADRRPPARAATGASTWSSTTPASPATRRSGG